MSITNFNLSGLDINDFGVTNSEFGYVGHSWVDPLFAGQTLPDGTIIYDLCLVSIAPGDTTSAVVFSAFPTAIEVTNPAGQIDNVAFNNCDILLPTYPIPPLISVTGGTLEMGCTPEQINCNANEGPVHEVTVSDFEIGKYEVTQDEWGAVVSEYTPMYIEGVGGNLPTYMVSWFDVLTYCNRISQADGLTPCYYADSAHTIVFDTLLGSTSTPYPSIPAFWKKDANGYRLPTEAEWEFAARGGNLSMGYVYSGSDTSDLVAWHEGNSADSTHPQPTLLPNELGIHHMSGNVWEWCTDGFDAQAYDTRTLCSPIGPDVPLANPVSRGGAFNLVDSLFLRVSRRGNLSPGFRSFGQGFRIAKGALTPPPCDHNLVYPLNGATGVPQDTTLYWSLPSECAEFTLALGTTPGGEDILATLDVSDSTSWLMPTLPVNTTIFVSLTPYNGVGANDTCTVFSFSTADCNDDTSTLLIDTFCTGDSYLFAGMTITTPGIYFDTIPLSTGCDSIITLELAELSLVNNLMTPGGTLNCANPSMLPGCSRLHTRS